MTETLFELIFFAFVVKTEDYGGFCRHRYFLTHALVFVMKTEDCCSFEDRFTV